MSSILRNPIYTVRSHRVGPCSSPPVPREVGPQGLHPRYVKSPPTYLHASRPNLCAQKATGAQSGPWAEKRPCQAEKGLVRAALGPQEE